MRKEEANNIAFQKGKATYPTWIVLILVLVCLWVLFSIMSKHFLKLSNIMNLLQYVSVLGVVSAGMLMMIIIGNMDLSVGSIVSLVGVCSATIVGITGSFLIGLVTGLAVGAICGALNGIMVTKLRINSLIATLGSMTFIRGLSFFPGTDRPISILNREFRAIGQGYVGPVPIIVIIAMIIIALVFLMLKYTLLGKQIFSVGGNENTSYLSGIQVNKVRFSAFLIMGVLAGIAGLLFAGMNSAGIPTSNEDTALEAITAVVLGGTSVKGGKGSMVGTILGILIMGTITNGLSLFSLPVYYQMIAKGLVLFVAISIDSFKERSAKAH
jgi:ribose/xylose/arabinose/galactoside ABC-type transport system permease subunit